MSMPIEEPHYESATVDNALNVIDTLVAPRFMTAGGDDDGEEEKTKTKKQSGVPALLQGVIDQLGLLPHPEGGYYRETDRSPLTMETTVEGKAVRRNYSTLIYYLLTPREPCGRFHKNVNRIVHTLHRGRGQYVLVYPGGRVVSFKVGYDAAAGEVSQWVVPGGVYKASFVLENDEFADGLLISEVVVPGFDFEDHSFLEGGVAELQALLAGDESLAAKLSFLL